MYISSDIPTSSFKCAAAKQLSLIADCNFYNAKKKNIMMRHNVKVIPKEKKENKNDLRTSFKLPLQTLALSCAAWFILMPLCLAVQNN